MSNVYDQAHSLAKAIKNSPEYQALLQAQQKVNGEDTSKRMLDDLQKTQMELQMKQFQGEQPTEDEIQKAQRLFETIQLNPTIALYLQAEQRFAVIMEDINKIMGEPLQALYPGEKE